MKRTMFVLQNEDGLFYCKNEKTDFFTWSLKRGLENAFLFKTRQGAERRRKLPFLSKCEIREVELKLV